jgi:hypothetical protein
VSDEPVVRRGLVAPEVAAEHPGLQLLWTEVEATPGPTPPELRARLAAMADRIRGPEAIALRGREVPHSVPRLLPPCRASTRTSSAPRSRR